MDAFRVFWCLEIGRIASNRQHFGCRLLDATYRLRPNRQGDRRAQPNSIGHTDVHLAERIVWPSIRHQSMMISSHFSKIILQIGSPLISTRTASNRWACHFKLLNVAQNWKPGLIATIDGEGDCNWRSLPRGSPVASVKSSSLCRFEHPKVSNWNFQLNVSKTRRSSFCSLRAKRLRFVLKTRSKRCRTQSGGSQSRW